MPDQDVGYLVVGDCCEFDAVLEDGTKYRGMDRDMPAGLYDAHCAKALPDRIVSIYGEMRDSFFCGTYLEFLLSVDSGREMLEYCRTQWPAENLELISFALQGCTPSYHAYDTVFLGYDLMFAGQCYSLVLCSFFNREEYFINYRSAINEYGLFSNTWVLDSFVAHYRLMAERDICEPAGAENDYLVLEINKILV